MNIIRRRFLTLLCASSLSAIAPGQIQAQTWNLSEAARKANAIAERKKRIKHAISNLPGDNFGYDGRRWKRFISLKGDRRITFKTDLLLVPYRTKIDFAAFYVSTGDPFAASFWILENGRNIDLAKKEHSGSFTLHPFLGVRELRAWGSKKDDVVFYLKATDESQMGFGGKPVGAP